MSRAVCWLVRQVEVATGTSWPQWPRWIQEILLKIT